MIDPEIKLKYDSNPRFKEELKRQYPELTQTLDRGDLEIPSETVEKVRERMNQREQNPEKEDTAELGGGIEK